MIKRDDKRGQGLSTKAIIVIVLGVTLLVFLILGFTLGWSNLLPFLGGEDNVSTIQTSCRIACSIEGENDYCFRERELRTGEETITGSCQDFSNNPSYSQYGIDNCPGLCGIYSGSSSGSGSGSSSQSSSTSNDKTDFNKEGTRDVSEESGKPPEPGRIYRPYGRRGLWG